MNANAPIVWIVKLSPSDKEYFEEIARKKGDTEYGAGARALRALLAEIQKELID